MKSTKACVQPDWARSRITSRSRSEIIPSDAPHSVLVLAAALTFERNEVWSSDLLLWQDSAEKSPLNGRAHMGLGDAYLVRGRCEEAAKEFEAVQRYEGPSDEMTTNLAASYQCNHQTDLALKTLRGVVARRPNAGFYAQIGYLEALLNHGDESDIDDGDQRQDAE